MSDIRTLAAAHTVEIERIKGSRFIGDAAPADDEGAALAFVESIRVREPSATHHCWAYRIDDDRERSSDDGEPSGSAGAPILRRIGGAELERVVVVVTRYYGGTKLGTGGLVRAYGAAAAAVLADAPVDVRPVLATLAFRHTYDLSGAVQGVIVGHGATVIESDYGLEIDVRVTLPVEMVEAFVAELSEATAGRVLAARCARRE